MQKCSVTGCSAPVRARGLCSKHEQRFRKYGQYELPERTPKPRSTCQADGCEKPTAYGRRNFCEAHYMRLHRKGNLELCQPKQTLEHTHGYVLQYASGHPLRVNKSRSHEYQHRIVFYDHHGDGPFHCHWCNITVTWSDMHVDHLNSVRDDNRLTNLVPSCPRCNQKRGQEKMRRTMRRNGRQLTAFGKTQSVSEWAQETGISRTTISWRIDQGWSVQKALTT